MLLHSLFLSNYQKEYKNILEKILRLNQLKQLEETRNSIGKRSAKLFRRILLRLNYSPHAEKVIVFLTPGTDFVCGGILSILSLYHETIKLKKIHGAEVVICTVPGEGDILKYTRFKNRTHLFTLSQALDYFQNLQHLIIHIPEYAIPCYLTAISDVRYQELRRIKYLHTNIMLQNIDLLPPMKYVEELKKMSKLTTCTTAHEKYTTVALRERLGIAIHRFSVFVSPEQYKRKAYREKEDIIVVSSDKHSIKSSVLDLLARKIPKIRIQVIENLTYERYRKIILNAKWALTFGEGLDLYFIETVFSGGISFSKFNPRFFTDDFKSLRTVYSDYDVLLKNICSDIIDLDHSSAYADYQDTLYKLCSAHYNYTEYINKLRLFYKGEYDIPIY